MARRNIFDNVMKAAEIKSADTPSLEVTNPDAKPIAKFGAAKSISSSIDELARAANRIILGEHIAEIDPGLIDQSFIADRMAGDDEAFHDLLKAIRERGQDSPVLLRPNPDKEGRFQIVFGHRRVRVARELNRPVRAVVKSLQDIDLVLAQGQENAARSNLSFIERVLFAQRLTDMGYARDVIQSSLSVDYQTLSKMLTLPKAIPAGLIDAIGPAKAVGRDRWLALRKLLERPGKSELAADSAGRDEFAALPSDERFAVIYKAVETGKAASPVKKALAPRDASQWVSSDEAVSAKISRAGGQVTLVLKSRALKTAKSHKPELGDFGAFVSDQLEELYRAFLKRGQNKPSGD